LKVNERTGKSGAARKQGKTPWFSNYITYNDIDLFLKIQWPKIKKEGGKK